MPWEETCFMDERIRLIALWNEQKMSVSELGRAFGISRKTVYKWVERYAEHGAAGLQDRTTVAHHHPHATAEALVSALVELRKERPTWGPKKLRARLAELGMASPAASTLGELLTKGVRSSSMRSWIRLPWRSLPTCRSIRPRVSP